MRFSLYNHVLRHIPNVITGARFVFTIAFLGMILYAPRVDELTLWMDWAFVLFVYTGLTDAIDGKLARMLNATSQFGRVVDPLADKILVCGSFICFAIIGEPVLFPETLGKGYHVVNWVVAGIIIAREVIVQTLRTAAESKGIQFGANVWGKLKMFIQIFGIGTVTIKMAHVPDAQWGMWFTTVVFAIMVLATVMSALQYFTRKEARQAGMGIDL